MSIKSEKILEIIKKIVKNLDFVTFDLSFSAGSSKGDNYLGEVTRIHIDGKKIDGESAKSSLILKCGVASAKRRQEFFIDTYFEREIYFYNVLMPVFNEFQIERNPNIDLVFSSYPKCLYNFYNRETDEYFLVFEDLCRQELEMWPRDIPSPVENIINVVRELAKFHAISFAMKDQKPTLFDQFKNNKSTLSKFLTSKNTRKILDSSYLHTIELLDNDEHIKIYKHLLNNLDNYSKEIFDDNKLDRFGVINHGDCWINNVMFHKSKVKINKKVSNLLHNLFV